MDFFGLLVVPNWLLIAVVVLVIIRYLTNKPDHDTFTSRGVQEIKSSIFQMVAGLQLMKKVGLAGIDCGILASLTGNKVYGIYEFSTPVFYFADPNLIKQITVKYSLGHFSDHRQDTKAFLGSVLKDSLTFKTGEQWKQTRNILSPVFSAGKLKKMMILINKVVDVTVQNLGEYADREEELKSKDVFGACAFDMNSSTLFGIELNSQKDKSNLFVKHGEKVFGTSFNSPLIIFLIIFPFMKDFVMSIPFVRRSFFNEESVDFFRSIVEKTVAERQRDGEMSRPDMIQLMLNTHKDDLTQLVVNDGLDVIGAEKIMESPQKKSKAGLSSADILSNALTFFLAGYDTTATTLSFLSHALARYPDIQTRLLQEIDEVVGEEEVVTYEMLSQLSYLDQVLAETLRMWPPAIRIDRECTQDIVLENGPQLRKGEKLSIPVYGIHHMEQYWPDPFAFNPERFTPEQKKERNPYTYLPFGIGPRGCIGMRLATMEIKAVVTKVLQNFTLKPGPNMVSDTEIHQFQCTGLTRTHREIKVMAQRRRKE